jgi:glycosyltransferase involved in cell wall biosynthesis
MKVNWFSPLRPAKTAIADYTLHVMRAFATRSEVTIWTDQSEWDPEYEIYGRVRQYHGVPDWSELNRADVTYYNIGNNTQFHGVISGLSRSVAGVVILHDTRLQHLFTGLYKHNRSDEYRAMMERYYGQSGLEAADAYLSGRVSIEDISKNYPLTPLAMHNALGAVVHVPDAAEPLIDEQTQPVLYAPLPYSASGAANPDTARQARRVPDQPPYRLMVFGFLGLNRRLDAILQALGGFAQRDKYHLHIYGTLDKPSEVKRLIGKCELANHVTIHGYVSETELDDALDASNLVLNLRYPSMGEASWSQLRLWSRRLPSLVTKTGWYASAPAETVAFVRPEHEIADIRRHLQGFLDNPGEFMRKGEAGYRVLRQDHSPEKYAETLLEFARQTHGYRNRLNAAQLVRRSGQLLGEWASPEEHAPLLQRIASEISRFAA